jgi:molybdopterin-containing oxidoreductase family iron-sulfur binding subunit
MATTDILVTMVSDLKRALRKPAATRRWAMLIDTRKCIGCHACTVGCIAENGSPPGVIYRPVFEKEQGVFPKVTRTFVPRPCQHCDQPPCVAVCPTGGTATWKSTDGVSAGTVVIDYARCIGCGMCVPACPYKARSLDEGRYYSEQAPSVPAYEKRPVYESGGTWPRDVPKLPVGVARKCHFCVHRLEAGMLPTCTTTCIGRATYFGDESDPESAIAQAKAAQPVTTLTRVADATPLSGSAAFGPSPTRPRVYYIR